MHSSSFSSIVLNLSTISVSNKNSLRIFLINEILQHKACNSSVLSIVLGYERRRDQIVSSSHIQGSLDVQLYGDGKNKKWFNYMPNLYIVFLCFFIICILSFTFFTLTSQMLFYHLPLYACIIDLGIISFVYFELWKKIKKLSNKK